MTKAKSGLGKGLNALIPAVSLMPNVESVDVNLIIPNPRQPRSSLDQATLEELADSIREHGVIQPLIVTEVETELRSPQKFQIIAGERRWHAAKIAGLTKVPVLVKEATASETLELALVENLQRSDLNPLEEARAYRQLIDEFGLTQEEVAKKVGKKRTTVANSLRLLNLSDELKRALASGEITEGHARALLGLSDIHAQRELLQKISARGLNVRQTEEAVRRWQKSGGGPAPTKQISKDAETRQLENSFRAALGTKVTLMRGRKGGKLVIHFYSEEELQAICDKLLN